MTQDMQKRLTTLAAQSMLGGALALAVSSPAQAKTYANLSISAGGKIASNPFLEAAGAPTGQAVSLEITPFVRMEGGTSSLTLRSTVRLDQYLKDYGSDLSGDIGANFEKKFSSQTSIRANGAFRSSRSTLRDILQFNNASNTSGIVVSSPGVLADPTLIGRNRRNNSWTAGIGLTTQPTRSDIVSVDFSINQLSTPGQTALDYRFLTLQTSLSHRLSSKTSLQLSVTGGKSEYLNQRAGNGYTITPMVGITTRINSSFTLTALAGTTFSKIDRGDGTKLSKTGWAAQVDLCKRSEREALCLGGARSTQPTAIGGVRAVTSANLNYSRRLSEKNTIAANLSFSQSGSGVLPSSVLNPTGDASTRYIQASTTLTRRFNQRFYGFFTPSLEHIKSNSVSQKLDYQINFGLRYVFGEIR